MLVARILRNFFLSLNRIQGAEYTVKMTGMLKIIRVDNWLTKINCDKILINFAWLKKELG